MGDMPLMILTARLLLLVCIMPHDPQKMSMTVKPDIAALASFSKIAPQANPRQAELKC